MSTPALAGARFALENLLVHRDLLAAGGVDGVFARGALKEGLAQRFAPLPARGQLRNARAERFEVAWLGEKARLAVRYELRYAADAGGDRGQAVRRALGYRVGEGLGYAREGVDVHGAVELVHVVQPAAEGEGVGHAELGGELREPGPLRPLAGDDEAYARPALPRLRDGAHQRGEVLHGVEPRRRAHDDVAGRDARAHALIEGRAVGSGYGAGEVDAVIDGKGVVPAEAALYEQGAHGVRDADVVFNLPERPGVEDAVAHRGQRAAEVVELPVAVYGADDGQPRPAREKRPGQVPAGAVRVYELEALRADKRLHLAERGEEAPGEDQRPYSELSRLLGEGPVAEADQGDLQLAGEAVEEGVDVGLGPARVAAAYKMYNFHFNLRAACFSRDCGVK